MFAIVGVALRVVCLEAPRRGVDGSAELHMFFVLEQPKVPVGSALAFQNALQNVRNKHKLLALFGKDGNASEFGRQVHILDKTRGLVGNDGGDGSLLCFRGKQKKLVGTRKDRTRLIGGSLSFLDKELIKQSPVFADADRANDQPKTSPWSSKSGTPGPYHRTWHYTKKVRKKREKKKKFK